MSRRKKRGSCAVYVVIFLLLVIALLIQFVRGMQYQELKNIDNRKELAERLFKGVDIDEHPEKKMLQRIEKLNQLIENETTKLDRLMDNYLDETYHIDLYLSI